MSGLNDELRKAIRQLAGTDNVDLVGSFDCTVTSVDEDAFTCDVEAIGSNATTEIPGVRLAAEENDGFTLIPAVGSTVTVVVTDRGLAYVSMFSDIDKVVVIIGSSKMVIENGQITFNDGTFNGLIKIDNLTTEINNRYTILKSAILAGFTAADASITALGGVAGAVTAYNGAIASFTNLNKTAYENTTIKHGQ
jgi:hypothetical protein